MTPQYRSVSDLLRGHVFSIDDYQRECKWGNGKRARAPGRLDRHVCCRLGNPTPAVQTYAEYFLGSLIVSQRDGRPYLIDGQQRVTSPTLLLIYLYRIAQDAHEPVSHTIEPLIYRDHFGKPQCNLDVPERRALLYALFRDQPLAGLEADESVETMGQRYRDIAGCGLLGELRDAWIHFAYWLMTRVGVIVIDTDDEAHAYTIFEAMNDRGRPLSPVGMMKAYLLSQLTGAPHRHHVNQVWKHEMQKLTRHGDPDPTRDAAFLKAWLRSQYPSRFVSATKGRKTATGSLSAAPFTDGCATTATRWARVATKSPPIW